MKGFKELIVLFVLAVFQVTPNDASSQDLSPPFNFAKNLETAYQLAKARSQPIMLITHKSGCPACKSLRPKLTASNAMISLSSSFIMVNNGDKQDAKAEAIRPDGRNYYPRIIFFDKTGRILANITNPAKPDYKYYFTDAAGVIDAMNTAMTANNETS